ncbi:uncharacterized protein EI90DRAFT_172435 [Cantharellus anzutake]|uniref:uncharacterized protein n=1 Tax=Cantharellus anzutake TaxID=1750568 RepID=UPI001907AB75|nr:uncharacterized protein EI90DRAFT_172435 [Cantharellus anzutake]KAF8336416.1 hypothetical protein EI90DRAFT_172435 [Cantharellus anzutake]
MLFSWSQHFHLADGAGRVHCALQPSHQARAIEDLGVYSSVAGRTPLLWMGNISEGPPVWFDGRTEFTVSMQYPPVNFRDGTRLLLQSRMMAPIVVKISKLFTTFAVVAIPSSLLVSHLARAFFCHCVIYYPPIWILLRLNIIDNENTGEGEQHPL